MFVSVRRDSRESREIATKSKTNFDCINDFVFYAVDEKPERSLFPLDTSVRFYCDMMTRHYIFFFMPFYTNNRKDL